MQRHDAVLAYWFRDLSVLETGGVPDDALSLWFEPDLELDRQIKERFGEDLERAGRGDYDDWKRHPASHLALLLLLDQFSRNIYRGTQQAFAFDDQALENSLDALDAEQDRAVSPIARTFFYMPLQHSEQLGHQQRCVALMQELFDSAPDDQRDIFGSFLDAAKDHRNIIEQFGRFPHRNEILGRDSTPDEKAYLEENTEAFGQA